MVHMKRGANVHVNCNGDLSNGTMWREMNSPQRSLALALSRADVSPIVSCEHMCVFVCVCVCVCLCVYSYVVIKEELVIVIYTQSSSSSLLICTIGSRAAEERVCSKLLQAGHRLLRELAALNDSNTLHVLQQEQIEEHIDIHMDTQKERECVEKSVT